MWWRKRQEDWAHQQDRFAQYTLSPKKQDKQRLKLTSWHIRGQMKFIPSKSTFYGASFEVPACPAKRKRLVIRHCVIFPVVNRLIICGTSFGIPICIQNLYKIPSGTWRIGLFGLPRWFNRWLFHQLRQSSLLHRLKPIQPTSLVQATLPILPPPTKSIPFVEPAILVQPLVVESAPLSVQSNLSVFKFALSFQGRPALPLVEPVPLDSPVPVPCIESPLPAATKSNLPTLTIIQEALEMLVLTKQNVEEKAVYKLEPLWSVTEIFTTNETSLSGSF